MEPIRTPRAIAGVAATAGLVFLSSIHEAAPATTRLAVAWNDAGSKTGALVGILPVEPPWAFDTPSFDTGPDSVLRYAGRRLFVVSPGTDTITQVHPRTLQVERVFKLPPGSEPLDIAVVGQRRAYVTRRHAARLLRIDLITEAQTESVDLSSFADGDGVPDLNMMERDGRRLFVQIRRLNTGGMGFFEPPAMIAVVDLRTEEIVDVDPATPEVEAIALEGTPPKMKMQVEPRSRQLFVGATGGFFDAGGLEVIDLRTLRTRGLVLREEDGQIGADLGAFVMIDGDSGFLVFSTDLLLSSHLKPFTISGGVEPGPEMHVSLDYFMPSLVLDRRNQLLLVPDGGFASSGIHVFDAVTRTRLTKSPAATSGPPSDLVLTGSAAQTLEP